MADYKDRSKMIKMRETVSPCPKEQGFKRDGSRNRTTILFLNKNEISVSFFVSKQRIFSTRNTKNIVFLCINKIVVLFIACKNFTLNGEVLHR